MALGRVEDAIAAIRAGEAVIVVDDEDRENEGDLIMAAESATPETIAFFLAHTSGIICVAMEGDRLDRLRLSPMVAKNTDSRGTAFTVSVDYRNGTSTGISAGDRAATIRALINPATEPEQLARPGHIFPLRARPGGVLRRAGHTEATVDLARAAGLYPAGVLCEVTTANKLGMARLPELEVFAQKHGLVIISIAELARYRYHHDTLIRRIPEANARIPTGYGEFTCVVYESVVDGAHHMALVKGDFARQDNVLVRVHSECLTGDVFGSLRCDCGSQLQAGLAKLAEESCGVMIYLRGHEGRGIGLAHKMRAYKLQERGRDTVDANTDLGLPVDGRNYGIAAQILLDLGVTSMQLLTNNPAKCHGMEGFGLDFAGRTPLPPVVNPENLAYLWAKRNRMGHLLENLPSQPSPSDTADCMDAALMSQPYLQEA